MLMLQFDEKLRRWNCVGAGRVFAKEGREPLHSVMVNNAEKITFVVNCGSTLTSANLPVSRCIICAAYSNAWNKKLFSLVKTLKKNDHIFFAGWVKINQTVNSNGEEVEYKELRVEYIARQDGPVGQTNSETTYEGSYGNDGLDFN